MKSKRTKALAISDEVRERVRERDRGLCVYCGKPGLPEAHFIARSHSGLGIEQNILTLCRPCHERFDRGKREEREGMKEYFRDYLMSFYPDWDEEKLYYKKGM